MTKQIDTDGFLIAQAQITQTLFTTQVPSLPNNSDGIGYELGMKFRSAKAGQITAIRFWKASGETGTHVGKIWVPSSSPFLAASVTFANETASGWQQQALATPMSIQANTNYIVSVSFNRNYAVTHDGLVSSVVNGDLSSVADGNNGVYSFTPGSFPTESYRNSNYFCDIVFVTGSSTSSALRVNSGGGNYNSASGVWSADTSFTGGSTYSTTATIANTSDPTLYQSERYGNFSYSLPVNNGSYTLRLHFAEIYFTSSGLRKFNVSVEGQQVLTNFDIVAEASAANKAIVKSFPVTISDGKLDLSFVSVVENAKISAIELVSQSSQSVPTIIKVSGDNQSGTAGSTLPNPLVVQVKDSAGNPQAGTTVSFAVTIGGGSVSPTSAVTNANGQASTVLTLGTTAGVKTVTATASVGSVSFTATANATSTNPIYLENQKTGTTAWKITNQCTTEIAGYAAATSVNRGGSLPIKVSLSQAGKYKIDVYRLGYYGGTGGRLMVSSGLLNGVTQPACTLNASTRQVECNWSTSYTVAVGSNWTSGLYIAKLTEQATGKQSQVWFVVRDDSSTSDILFQSSFTTFLAYNNTGGYSTYAFNSINGQRAFKVSFDSPFSETTTAVVEYNNLLRWERNMARWLESQGYNVSYVTNMDVHSNPQLLRQHKVFLSVGHDEYWSIEQRNGVEQARDTGVNLAFFSANTAYWRVRFENSSNGGANRVMACYKEAPDPVLPTNKFRSPQNNRPENALLGVMYTGDRPGLYGNTDTSNPTYGGYNFVVTNSSNSYYANTNLRDGDTLSLLVGYEWDAVVDNGFTPNGLIVLGASPVSPTSTDTDLPPGTNTQISHAVRYTAASGAKVFSTGSIQWMWGLSSDVVNPLREDIRAKQIAVNVLADMQARPLTPDPNIIVP